MKKSNRMIKGKTAKTQSYTYTTELGPITITEENGYVTEVLFGDFGYYHANTPLTDEAALQIEEYLKGKRDHFTIPIQQDGSEFDHQVWDVLLNIPIGEKKTYAQIAQELGRPSAARAVGNACGRNRIAILIPCHRSVRSDGTIGGYAWGADLKKRLLKIESDYKDSQEKDEKKE